MPRMRGIYPASTILKRVKATKNRSTDLKTVRALQRVLFGGSHRRSFGTFGLVVRPPTRTAHTIERSTRLYVERWIEIANRLSLVTEKNRISSQGHRYPTTGSR